MKRIIFFNEDGYIEYPIEQQFDRNNLHLGFDNIKNIFFDDKCNEIIYQKEYKIDEQTYTIIGDNSKCYLKEDNVILIGQENTDINIAQGRYIIDGETIISDKSKVFINGKRCIENKNKFSYGDQILLDENILLYVHEKFIKIIAGDNSYKSYLPHVNTTSYMLESFPEYKRSPRIIKRVKDDRINISKPPTKIGRKKNSLVKVIVPPLVMACGTVAMSLMMGRGLYMLIGLAGTLVSLVFSITTYFSDKKELKASNDARKRVYEEYLLKMQKKLAQYKKKEVDALHYNNPNLKEIEAMVMQYNSRIYERDVNDDDFLTITVGKADDKCSYQVVLDYDALQVEKDELLDEAKEIYNEYQMIKNKPITVDLKRAHLGLVGEKREIHEQLKWFISQITFFHSYHDVQIVMLYNNEYKEEFDYIRWYPHVKILANNLTGNIHNERVRDQVLGSLHQILKDRKLKRDENKKEMSFLPHFVIIVDDFHLIMNHSIMEYLQETTTELGFSLIFTAQKRANLPENIKTVLQMEDMNTAKLLLNEGNEENKKLAEQRVGDVDLETMARNLAVLKHIQGVSSHIPEAVTFFEMYKVKTPEELEVFQRWQKGQSHKSLAVPLGLRAVDDIVELNLHEKAHGPHGLVAGTTGSGKSETIQSYILSLAVNFSPYEVGFLLIDYKGGGMANLFKKLPHLLGTITNLDGAESMRALASIKAELARRQRVFNDHNVNNINKYNKLFKSQKATEPLPHLFIISDEFAELKKEQPDFMSELVSVARIGRTLGVHLILATQKPTGVVDDQIWSNSKFKLALKVQDENDSKEIIKTPDAAFITQVGRAYLQVGNNEIYELFQSAWSGAAYSSKEEVDRIDDRIYKINLLGQGELINRDLSDKSVLDETMTTQLDATVDYMANLYSQSKHKEVMKPWLPSLKTNIASKYIDNIKNIEKVKKLDLNCPLGLIDIPEEQKQIDYEIDFIKEGNLAIFSSSGYGKSTTLGTIMLTLAVKNNPQLMNYYLLDFGNSSLIPYKVLPHVADYMTFDSEEKLSKFQKILTEEIKSRKQLFAREMVQNFDMYNKLHQDQPLRAIFMIIDNFDVVKEISMEFEEFIMKTTRDGVGLGIFTIISATRANAVRFATLNNFKNKIIQYLFDDGDVISLLGRSPYKLSEIKGRALVKQKIISMMQVYAPVVFKDDVEFITNLKNKIQDIFDHYTGPKVRGIPVLPEVFTTKDFINYNCETTNKNIVGLSLDRVENVSVDLHAAPYLILGPAKSGKTNLLEILINQCSGISYIFDSDSMELYKYHDVSNINYIDSSKVNDFIEVLFAEVEKRRAGLEEALTKGMVVSPRDYFNKLPDWMIYIDDADSFIQKVQSIAKIASLLEQAAGVGIGFVATVNSNKLKGFDEVTKFFKNATNGAVLGQMGTLNIFPLNMRDIPNFGYAVLCANGDMQRVKLPKYMGF